VQWEIDLSIVGKITEKAVGKAEQYDLDLVDTGWTDNELCGWLERKCRQPDITQAVLLEFVRRTLAYLVDKRALPLTALVRWLPPHRLLDRQSHREPSILCQFASHAFTAGKARQFGANKFAERTR
jgi:hypothetical protein